MQDFQHAERSSLPSASIGERPAQLHEKVGTVDKFQGQEAPVVFYSTRCGLLIAVNAPYPLYLGSDGSGQWGRFESGTR